MGNVKSTTGIGGILDNILSAKPGGENRMHDSVAAKSEAIDSDESATISKIAARKGRPPGKVKERREPKEKMTVWLDAALIAEYRDWSWDARCQLSTLVEEALLAHQNCRGNRNTSSR